MNQEQNKIEIKQGMDPMNPHYYAVIMAGGGGTRLWPLSRKERPKQMLSLVGENSLFQMAVNRLEAVFPPERIFIVTVEDQASALQKQCPDIPAENFLLETMPRGTAAVVGYAAAVLQEIDPEAVMAVLTADHIIGNQRLFEDILEAARQTAEEEYLVTLGIDPTYPATGYGYIHLGSDLGDHNGLSVSRVLNFTEKPDLKRAEEMLANRNYAWNSGMFFWRVEVILQEISRQMPDLAQKLAVIGDAWGTPEAETTIRKVWPEIQRQTIDYGIMEHAKNVAVIPAVGLNWNDVGSWDALYDVLEPDQDGNISRGADLISLASSGMMIYTAENPRTVVTIGTEDLIIVNTGDILLVCSRENAQQVREVVRKLENESRTDLL